MAALINLLIVLCIGFVVASLIVVLVRSGLED